MLGWDGSVADIAATAFAAKLYDAPQGDDGRFDLCVAVNVRNVRLALSDRAADSNEGIKVDTGDVSGLNMIAARFSPTFSNSRPKLAIPQGKTRV